MSLKFGAAFWSIVAAQMILLLAIVGVKEYTLATGTTVVLQTVPVDPRSLFQGDFAVLGYEIGTLPPHLGNLPSGSTVYVALREGAQVWEATRYTTSRPPEGEVFIEGTVDPRGRLDFGIGTFFVPEGTGHIIEQSTDVKVNISVDGRGNAVIKELLVDGKPFNP